MKTSLSTLIWLFVGIQLFAQVPSTFNYQAVIRDSEGKEIINTNINLRITIISGTSIGTPVYTETNSKTTNEYGLVSIEIGAGTTSDEFSQIDWSNAPYYLKVEVKTAGNTEYIHIGTSQLLSVPYANFAHNVDTIVEKDPKFSSSVASSITSGDTTRWNNSTPCFTHYIGEIYGGGIIFYLYLDSNKEEHGLIASLEDLSTGIVWSNITTACGATSPWDGLTNSNTIVAQAGHTESAAKLCLDYTNDGFDDWYLPSLDELFLLTNARYLINVVLENDGNSATNGFQMEHYCSSTEYFGAEIMSTEWGNGYGTIGDNSKSRLYHVRAVRKF